MQVGRNGNFAGNLRMPPETATIQQDMEHAGALQVLCMYWPVTTTRYYYIHTYYIVVLYVYDNHSVPCMRCVNNHPGPSPV